MGTRFRRVCILTKQGSRLPCFYVGEVDSTNNFAKIRVKDGKIDSTTVLIAKRQTSGRGRYERVFLSPKGGIYLTYIREIQSADCAALGCYCALSVVDTLAELGLDDRRKVSLKWPNDVKVDGKKICGILPETVLCGNRRFLLVGVGLNLNTAVEELKGVAPNATSVSAETHKKYRVASVARRLAFHLDEVVSAFLNSNGKDGYGAIDEMHLRYLDFCESVGLGVTYTQNGETLSGVAETVSPDGCLILTDGRKIGWGEISYTE